MERTKYARKIDSMGRITIPVRLREMMDVEIGEIYTYWIKEDGKKRYLCIECPDKA